MPAARTRDGRLAKLTPRTRQQRREGVCTGAANSYVTPTVAEDRAHEVELLDTAYSSSPTALRTSSLLKEARRREHLPS